MTGRGSRALSITFIACVIVTAILAFASFGSAMGKIQGTAQMSELLGSVGVSASMGRTLGWVQLAGAAGIVVGAMGAHARAKHPVKQVLFPFPLVVPAVVALGLRIVMA